MMIFTFKKDDKITAESMKPRQSKQAEIFGLQSDVDITHSHMEFSVDSA